jgi:hypothetical protein
MGAVAQDIAPGRWFLAERTEPNAQRFLQNELNPTRAPFLQNELTHAGSGFLQNELSHREQPDLRRKRACQDDGWKIEPMMMQQRSKFSQNEPDAVEEPMRDGRVHELAGSLGFY